MLIRLLLTVLGAGVGAAAASAWWWMLDVHARAVVPSMGRGLFLLSQIPPLWLAYATAAAFIYSIMLWMAATYVGRRRERKHGPARRRSATWASLVHARARVRELEAAAEHRTERMQTLLDHAREQKRKLAGIEAVLHSGPVLDEVTERRRLEGLR